MSDSDDDFLCWIMLEENVLLKKRRAKTWLHEFNIDLSRGEFFTTCVPMRNYPDKFKEYYRMSIETFDYILRDISKFITGESNFRMCISPEEKLTISLCLFFQPSLFFALFFHNEKVASDSVGFKNKHV
jgi:hypothetical protein